MDATKPQNSASSKIIKAFENETHEMVRPAPPAATTTDEPLNPVIRAGAASVAEIEKLMAELQAARDYLEAEGERLRREEARYAHLTQTALASVKIISEGMDKWRENAPPNLNRVA
jgi:DNA repair ATPase RecN